MNYEQWMEQYAKQMTGQEAIASAQDMRAAFEAGRQYATAGVGLTRHEYFDDEAHAWLPLPPQIVAALRDARKPATWPVMRIRQVLHRELD